MSNDNLPTYHKIQSVFKRDPATKYKTFLDGQWAVPEFEYLADLEWIWTEKVDGTNIRFHCDKESGLVLFGGRTHKAELSGDLVTTLADIAAGSAWSMANGLTVFGEGYGAGIQKGGGLYGPDKSFIVFDIMVTDSKVFLERKLVEELAAMLGLPVAPIVGRGSLWDAIFSTQQREGALWSRLKEGEHLSEGLVLRPVVELRTRRGGRIITKLKIDDWPIGGADVFSG